MDQLGADLEHHDTASAQRDVNFDYGLGSATDELARSLALVRALLVPSLMKLLGRWNWYLPERTRRTLRLQA